MSLAAHRDFESDSPTLTTGPDYSSYQQFRLEVVEGPDAGKVIVSTSLRVVIGSDASADLVLTDSEVAAFQCEIVAQGDRIDIIDLVHSNTTRVNDLEVEKAFLSRPVIIGVGSTKIRFERLACSLHVRRSRETGFAHLVGNSAAMRDMFTDLERCAISDAPVVIEGEAGSGKEAVARAIHRESRRRSAPFHKIDCSGTQQQVERDLIAAFEQAAGGTMFLDEVALLSEDLQRRLLRVFENGGPGAVANWRILASCTVDLRRAVNEGRFHPRLHRRLRGEVVVVPPLRRRAADFPRLVSALLDELGVSGEPFAETVCGADFMSRLHRYRWPGNVRELRNHLLRCMEHETLLPVGQGPANLNQQQQPAAPSSPQVDISMPIKAGREEWIKHFERAYLADMLASQGGNVTRAAKAAGVDRGHFYRLMMRCGLRD